MTRHPTTRLLCVMSAALACATHAHAATQLGEYVTVSGFGTAGYVHAKPEGGEFVRDGQLEGASPGSLKVDSNLGLQLTANATPWLSATVQVVAMQRRGESDIKADADWAFVKATPLNGLALRVGRMPLAIFAISDSRNIGYANNWVRPPDEVYGLSLLERMKGVDASYRIPLGKSSLTLSAATGKTNFRALGNDLKVDSIRNLNLTWESDGVSVRFGRLTSQILVSQAVPGQPDDKYTFTGVGVTYDRDDVFLQAEYVTRKSVTSPGLVDAKGWYTMAGYRFGQWLPYVLVSNAKSDTVSPLSMIGEQKTSAVGVRWDVMSSASLKFQYEHVDTNNSHGVSFKTISTRVPGVPIPFQSPVTKPVNALSVALDFVF